MQNKLQITLAGFKIVTLKRKALFRKSYLVLFLLIGYFQSTAQPNSDSSITRARVDKYYINSYFKDYRDIFECPFKPSLKKYSLAAVYGGSMYLLISHYDAKIQVFAQDHRSSFSNSLSKYVLEPTGSGIYPALVVGLLYAEGVIWKDQKSKKVAMNCTKSFLIATSFAQIAKYAATRQRPDVSPADPRKWEMGSGNSSFFSGHTTTAFSVATVLAQEYKSTVWVPIVAYTLATGTGLSRINDNRHWASDVVTGALCGYLTGMLIEKQNNWGIKVVPRIIIQ
jgi:hypothetical protein